MSRRYSDRRWFATRVKVPVALCLCLTFVCATAQVGGSGKPHSQQKANAVLSAQAPSNGAESLTAPKASGSRADRAGEANKAEYLTPPQATDQTGASSPPAPSSRPAIETVAQPAEQRSTSAPVRKSIEVPAWGVIVIGALSLVTSIFVMVLYFMLSGLKQQVKRLQNSTAANGRAFVGKPDRPVENSGGDEKKESPPPKRTPPRLPKTRGAGTHAPAHKENARQAATSQQPPSATYEYGPKSPLFVQTEHTVSREPPEQPVEAPTSAPQRVAASAPMSSPREVTDVEFLEAIQAAASGVLGDGIASDAAVLTNLVFNRVADEFKLDQGAYQINAHSSSIDLMPDLNNPDFISITRNRRGDLIPHRRASYAHSFVKYFDGDSSRWPRFTEPATCTLDDAGKASLRKKGRL